MQPDVHEVCGHVLDAWKKTSRVRNAGGDFVFPEQLDEPGLGEARVANFQRVAERLMGQRASFSAPGQALVVLLCEP